MDQEIQVVPDGTLLSVPEGFNPEKQIEEGKRAAKALMQVTKPIDIKGKKYLRFEDWQTLGRFYNLTVGVEWTKQINDPEPGFGFGARANVMTANGQIISSAEAQCTRSENTWKNRDDFALRSMAQTRAQAKAFRNVLSWVAVLAGMEGTPAEEMPEAPFVGNEYVHSELKYDESNNAPPPEYKKKPSTYSALNQNDPTAPHPPCKHCGKDMAGYEYWQTACRDCFTKRR